MSDKNNEQAIEDAKTWEDGLAQMLDAIANVDERVDGVPSDFYFGKRRVEPEGWYWGFVLSKGVATVVPGSPKKAWSPRRRTDWFKAAVAVALESRERDEEMRSTHAHS